ncbi:alpha/beta hydrolase [Cryobacterium sp. TMT2-10]|uniref:Alpha/beta hydrolase n=1 Tax=Cryobacterium shii TaxID=1259235 RepID=A0AAQ2C920_9MICO|nr:MULTISPECIES: alpha/beta hydrolase [Cryobacterium]TFC52921.1 alpha/beta hydrolase [Cryobacterium shii]TFC81100.1 alpha/beta hydrolase [Cryobacterium sp. TmT2-59]TFD21964.1 alpha/beta hydrolase [Cryobacterium sp. TMT2-23]TFD43196.1 alpha/beta hydrolase [Cryobacterium sp. TMT2-10]
MIQTVQSADGTSIAYEKSGSGPALILVGGAFNTRQSPGPLVPPLAEHFTVYTYDRRGRGYSTDVAPYATDREVEDLAALIDAAGGTAMLYGHSSGAILGLLAAASGLPITRLAAYEPPFTAEERGSGPLDGWGASVQAALDDGDRARAAQLFMLGTGADPAMVAGMSESPWWPGLLAIAHTLPYDLALTGDGLVPAGRLARIPVPVLVVVGGDSPPWAAAAAGAVARAVPGATQVTLDGQTHNVDAAALAPVLIDFFG